MVKEAKDAEANLVAIHAQATIARNLNLVKIVNVENVQVAIAIGEALVELRVMRAEVIVQTTVLVAKEEATLLAEIVAKEANVQIVVDVVILVVNLNHVVIVIVMNREAAIVLVEKDQNIVAIVIVMIVVVVREANVQIAEHAVAMVTSLATLVVSNHIVVILVVLNLVELAQVGEAPVELRVMGTEEAEAVVAAQAVADVEDAVLTVQK